MKKGALLLLTLIVAVSLPMSLAAQEKKVEMKKCEAECKEGFHKQMMMKKLDPEVKLQLDKLRIEMKLANIDLQKEKAELHKKIMDEFAKDEPSRKVIEKLSAKVLDVQGEMMANRHDYMLKARKIAGPEHLRMFTGGGGCCGGGCEGMKCHMEGPGGRMGCCEGAKCHMEGPGGRKGCCEGGMLQMKGCGKGGMPHMEGCGGGMMLHMEGCDKDTEGCHGKQVRKVIKVIKEDTDKE